MQGCTSALPSSSHNAAVSYQCDSGKTIIVNYVDIDSAQVQYEGESYNMKIAISASGSRYVGDEFEWWSKGSGIGSDGTLFYHSADSSAGDAIEFCIAL